MKEKHYKIEKYEYDGPVDIEEIELEKIDNLKYCDDITIGEERSAKIIECLEYNPQDFFQTLINEFAVEYDSNVMTEEMILKLQECKRLAEKLVS